MASVKFYSDTSNFFSFQNFHIFSMLNLHFDQIKYFFKGLGNRFWNSILFQHRVGGTPLMIPGNPAKSHWSSIQCIACWRRSCRSFRAVSSVFIKLDAHGTRPVRFLGACDWFRGITWCVWYGLRSSRSESEQWVWCVNIEAGSYSNADHTRRIRIGRDVTKSDARAQEIV